MSLILAVVVLAFGFHFFRVAFGKRALYVLYALLCFVSYVALAVRS